MLIVLDTNAVLDWLLFDDPHGRAVGLAIVTGVLDWIAAPAMREEYFEVLDRPCLARWAPDPRAQRRVWEAHCKMRPDAPTLVATPALRSADPDDQMFVDLALSNGAVWLLSRDRALLDLAPALRPRGVRAMTPAAWVASQEDGPE